MPVLNAGRDGDFISREHFHSGFAPFLIVAVSADADQNLSAAFFCFMNMPVVAAARFEGHVEDGNTSCADRSQPGFAGEELGKAVIGVSDGEEDCRSIILKLFFCIGLFRPDFKSQAEGSPGFGPAGIESSMG